MESEYVENAEATAILTATILSLLMLGVVGVIVYSMINDNTGNG